MSWKNLKNVCYWYRIRLISGISNQLSWSSLQNLRSLSLRGRLSNAVKNSRILKIKFFHAPSFITREIEKKINSLVKKKKKTSCTSNSSQIQDFIFFKKRPFSENDFSTGPDHTNSNTVTKRHRARAGGVKRKRNKSAKKKSVRNDDEGIGNISSSSSVKTPAS